MLTNLVRQSAKAAAKRFKDDPALRADQGRAEIPDPQAEATFLSAKLDWSELDRSPYRITLEWYKRIIEARRAHIAPLIPSLIRGGTFTEIGYLAVSVTWQATDGTSLRLDINLKDEEQVVICTSRFGGLATGQNCRNNVGFLVVAMLHNASRTMCLNKTDQGDVTIMDVDQHRTSDQGHQSFGL